MARYVAIIALVFLVDLLPVFGPPVWLILVVAQYRYNMPVGVLVPLGALGATSGRLVLALGSRHFASRVPRRARENLESARDFLSSKRKSSWAVIAAFIISPLPSGQLFVAAGLLNVALRPLGLAFFVGRLVSLSVYLGLARVAETSLGDLIHAAWGEPWMIACQIVLLTLVCAIPFIPWKSLKYRR